MEGVRSHDIETENQYITKSAMDEGKEGAKGAAMRSGG
jgi:hypothetical protein